MKLMKPDPARRMARLALIVISLVEVAAIALVAMSSCSKKDKGTGPLVVPPPPAGTPADLLALVRRSLPARFLYPALDLFDPDSAGSFVVSADVSGAQASAAAFRGSLGLADAGAVSVDAASAHYVLERQGLTISSIPQYLYSTLLNTPVTISLPFDGTATHSFRANGAAFPAWEDQIQSVGLLTLTWPPGGATLSRNEDALLSWNVAGDGSQVMAAFYLPSDTTLHIGTVYGHDADGSLMVPAAMLQAVPHPGVDYVSAVVSVARFRTVFRTVAGRSMTLMCESATSRTVGIVDSTNVGVANRPQLAQARSR